MLFTETLAAAAAGERVMATHLVKFDFEDEPFYAWEGGAGILRAAGQEWRGLGEMGRIDSLPLGVNDSAGQARFMLSGVDPEFVVLARSEADKVAGREVTVWMQFLTAPQRPLDDPVFMCTFTMNAPSFQFSGPQDRTISVTARSRYDGRKKTSFAYYADRDQNARFPGDRFFEQAAKITTGLVIRWPKVSGGP